MCNQNTFGARTNHEQTWIHKIHRTHHGPYLGKPPPSPLQYSLCLATGSTPKCHFLLGLPNGNPKILKIRTPTTFEAHNFVCKPSIKVRSKAKLQHLSRTFQWHVIRHLYVRKLGQFPTFSDWQSNWQFDSRHPFFWP